MKEQRSLRLAVCSMSKRWEGEANRMQAQKQKHKCDEENVTRTLRARDQYAKEQRKEEGRKEKRKERRTLVSNLVALGQQQLLRWLESSQLE